MNIPHTNLDNCKTIMIVGVGGGFDVFTGLPFVYHWPDKNFVLVNSSPSNTFTHRDSTPADYPEGLIDESNVIAKYSVGRHGVKHVKRTYEAIAAYHQVGLVLAVDGGVDSLAQGDEEFHGTILEDFIALAALQNIGESYLCCAGFGTETEENINHYRILENMAALAADGSFIGSFSLTKEMPEFQKYAQACRRAWANNRKSHIQTKIIAAAEGKFGHIRENSLAEAQVANAQDNVFISPLSSIFWMYKLAGVIKKNKFIKDLSTSATFADAQIILRNLKQSTEKRSKEVLPL